MSTWLDLACFLTGFLTGSDTVLCLALGFIWVSATSSPANSGTSLIISVSLLNIRLIASRSGIVVFFSLRIWTSSSFGMVFTFSTIFPSAISGSLKTRRKALTSASLSLTSTGYSATLAAVFLTAFTALGIPPPCFRNETARIGMIGSSTIRSWACLILSGSWKNGCWPVDINNSPKISGENRANS